MRSITPDTWTPSTSIVNRYSSAAGIRNGSRVLPVVLGQDLPGVVQVQRSSPGSR